MDSTPCCCEHAAPAEDSGDGAIVFKRSVVRIAQVRMLADPQAELAKALGVDFDASGMLGNVRSKRYALSGMTTKLRADGY